MSSSLHRIFSFSPVSGSGSLLLPMSSTAVAVVLGGVLLLVWAARSLTPYHDPREPFLVPPKIPVFGHLIGVLANGTGYYSQMAERYTAKAKDKGGIFTLPVPNGKMYIVTSPSMIAACDRKAKVVSFSVFVVEFARRILAGSSHAVDLLNQDLKEEWEREGKEIGLRQETMRAMHKSLMGENLDVMMRSVMKSLLALLDEAIGEKEEVVEKPLFGFLQDFLTMAGTNFMFGEENNPFQDKEVMKGFWLVDRCYTSLGLNVRPDLIAKEANRGREKFFEAFRKFYANPKALEQASYIIKARYQANRKHGVSLEDIARFDLGVCTALLVNTVPAAGWALCRVYSDENILKELRSGIEAVVFPDGIASAKEKQGQVIKVNMWQVTDAFPLLESFMKEVLRVESNNASARFVLEDTMIEDRESRRSYLLKKGSFLGMPSATVHGSEAAWGSTAKEFDPRRFLDRSKKISPSAWRTFGGGNALCPGRHLALNELTSILAMMVLRYDIEPVERGSGGGWKMPAKGAHISTSILTPAKDIQVRIRSREEVTGLKWDLVWEVDETRKE